MSRDPTCLFRCDAELLLALEGALGPPIDSYLMGWQVWLEPTELPEHPTPVELEYRLHPPPHFRQPAGLSHHGLWDAVIGQVVAARKHLRLGEEERILDEVWRLLEVYPAFGEDPTPEALRHAAEAALGRPALAAGYVDHERLGARWKREKGTFDLPAALLAELGVEHDPS
ncbi:MAG: hypothetical protein M3N32_09900 [Actinomycetota bacterium]|nr:hypothetical protein [Actinomycetota bacterium]